MRTGLLKDKIDIYRSITDTNEFGEQIQNYVCIFSTRSRIINNNGSRENSNGEIFYSYTKIFEVWKYVDIVENTDYILYKNKKYRILSIEENDEQNKKIINTELINE
mgnify:CR=1 FL=1